MKTQNVEITSMCDGTNDVQFIVAGRCTYGSFESRQVYHLQHAPTQADFDFVAATLDGGNYSVTIGE